MLIVDMTMTNNLSSGRGMDLNQLQTFVTIYRHRSITAAARALSLSQPAVSHALNRLRRRFADPLFVRSGSGVRPTTVATALFDAIAQPLQQIALELAGAVDFTPSTSTQRFRIALTDLGETTLLPAIVRLFAIEAPGARLDVLPLDTERIGAALAEGAVDAAVASTHVRGAGRHETLFTDRYGCLAPASLAAPGGRIEEAAFRSMPWAAVAANTGHTMMARAAEAAGMAITPRVTVRSFSALPTLVADQGFLAAVPSDAFAHTPPPSGTQVLDPPYPAPTAEVMLLSARPQTLGPAQRWFLDILRRAARPVPRE